MNKSCFFIGTLIFFISGTAYAHSTEYADQRTRLKKGSECESQLKIGVAPSRRILLAIRSSNYTASSGNFERYPIDGTYTHDDPVSYNSQFMPVLDGQTIEQFSSNRRATGRSTHVLDLFGSAVFSNAPDIFDSLTGVRFQPLDPAVIVAPYPVAQWAEITGDIFKSSTWQSISVSMRSRNIKGFDLITLRPAGSYHWMYTQASNFPKGRQAFLGIGNAILDRAWNLLNEDGTILVQISRLEPLKQFNDWINQLKLVGIESAVSPHSLRLTKTLNSPKHLPKM